MPVNKQVPVQILTNNSKLKIKEGFESEGAAPFKRYRYIINIYKCVNNAEPFTCVRMYLIYRLFFCLKTICLLVFRKKKKT